MAVDTIARGLAGSMLGSDGKISLDKRPVMGAIEDTSGFTPVGNLTDPTTIEGKTAEEILFMMLYGIANPTFADPSLSITLDEGQVPLIIGREQTLKGALVFDRGSINPAYGTTGYRAGLPTEYIINSASFKDSNFEIQISPTETNVILNYNVTYEAGEQPLNSVGQPVDMPYPAGTISNVETIKAVYQLYNATEELEFEWFEDEEGEGYLANFASEGSGIRQSFAISDQLTIIGVKAFDTMTQQWSWLGGQTAAVSLTHFDTTKISKDSLGEMTDYILYTHNQPASGEREMRIYVI